MLVVECIPNLWWGCCKVVNLMEPLGKVEAAYVEAVAAGIAPNIIKTFRGILASKEGQNQFG